MSGWLTVLAAWGIPLALTVGVVVAIYFALQKLIANQTGQKIYRQLAIVGLLVFMMVALALVMPISAQLRGQLLSLFGLVLTAIIALSSTTFVSNAMAGLMLKLMRSFETGDFVRVADHFGRVTARALLHTEIQSIDRDLVTLPNLFLITNPVQVVQQTGTLISANVSIGYDVHRKRVSAALQKAAVTAGLTDPFVHISELGNFAVGFKVTGFLEDVTTLVSKQSELKAGILDELHNEGIEIVSPTVMIQRPLDPSVPIVPAQSDAAHPEDDPGKAEQMMFDRADLAARMQRLREQVVVLKEEVDRLKEAGSDGESQEIAWRARQIESLTQIIEEFDSGAQS